MPRKKPQPAQRWEAVNEFPIADLVPWPDNPRRNDAAVGPLVDAIRDVGFTNPLLVRRADRMVIAGHTRLKAAKRLQLQTVPVVLLDVSEQEARKIAIADNKLGEIATWDDDGLRRLLEELDSEGVELGLLGFTGAEIDKLFAEDDTSVVEWDASQLQSGEQIVVLLDAPFSRASAVREALDALVLPYRLHLRYADGGAEP
jgi:ParB-like chromosome segregation protein Spo0J